MWAIRPTYIPRMIRRLASALATAVLLMSLATTAAHAEETSSFEGVSLLFVFEGRDVSVKPVAGQQGSFTVSVPITQANKRVTWFTDRPDRQAGRMTMDSLVALWQNDEADGFRNEPPNAALTVGQKVVVATMTDPQIKEGKDGSRSLVSTMTLVNADKVAELASGDSFVAKQAQRVLSNTRPKAATLPLVSFFVDTSTCVPGSWNPCPLW